MRILDRPFRMFAALALVSGTVGYLVPGREAFLASLTEDLEVLILVAPKLGTALLVAGLGARIPVP